MPLQALAALPKKYDTCGVPLAAPLSGCATHCLRGSTGVVEVGPHWKIPSLNKTPAPNRPHHPANIGAANNSTLTHAFLG